ncbi:MAG TPA: hypothetical protein DHW02_04550 [Ktedonobacter sp.]|nr:hypothetical protein [Ktedonobacter sp.]
MARRILLILIGAIVVVLVLVGVGVFVLLPKITSASSPQATPTVVSTTGTPTKGTVLLKTVRENLPAIKSQIAQGLNMTPDQLTTQLLSGQTLTQIATSKGVSSTQLQSIISTAFTTSLQSAVSNGTVTQKQVSAVVKRYQKNPDLLDKVLGAKTTKKSVTPTPTAAQ